MTRMPSRSSLLQELDVDRLVIDDQDGGEAISTEKRVGRAGARVVAAAGNWRAVHPAMDGMIDRGYPGASRKAYVFFISIATVMGPTPPGTGVIFAQSGATVAK